MLVQEETVGAAQCRIRRAENGNDMSLKDVQISVEKFLSSDQPQTIAISGEWGSGKTYFWNQIIRSASFKGKGDKYSYVSLFGMGNIADLKSAIFDNAIEMEDVRSGATSYTWVKNAAAALQAFDNYQLNEVKAPIGRILSGLWKRISPVLPTVSAWGGVAKSLSFMAIKDYVICLDDIERKAAGLLIKEVLGLASMLREERHCRVIMILNVDALGADNDDLKTFKEKVFDVDIVFSPTAEERAKLVFSDEWELSRPVADKVVRLGIKNIRIMQRIRRVIETLLPYVRDKDAALTRQLIHSSALLTWCYYGRGEEVPAYDTIRSDGFLMLGALARDKKEKSKEDELIERIQYDYGYNGTDEFDQQICHLLENGYVVEEELSNVVESFQELAIKNNHNGSFTQAWALFHDTFSNNENELVETLSRRFQDGVRWISLGNAMGTVKLMRELGYDDVGDQLMRHWIEMAITKDNSLLNLNRTRLFGENVDERFKEAVEQAYASGKVLPPLGDTIIAISGRNGWGDDQIETMSRAGPDDYYAFFKSINGDLDLGSYVRACLNFGDFGGDERYKAIHDAAAAALRKIAAESHLNKIRVERFLPSQDN